MQQAFLDIYSVKTNVITYGRWVEEPPEEPEDIILLIPGNPGVVGFYQLFMQILHEETGHHVWAVAHAGHEVPEGSTDSPIQPVKGNEALFGIMGQIEHKKDFINKYVPKNAKIHFIGHSFGSYVILNLLKEEYINSRVVDVCLLFPVIEYLEESPMGTFLTTYVVPRTWLLAFFASMYKTLPLSLQTFLAYSSSQIMDWPKIHLDTLIRLFEPSVMEKVFHLGTDKEVALVKQRDNEIIRANKDKIKFLYGEKDSWVPLEYCENLKNDISGVHVEYTKCEHAFALRHQSREVADVVINWLSR